MSPARICLYLLLAIAGAAPASAAEPDPARCVAPSFSYDAAAALESCAALLKNDALSDSERARLLTLRGRSLKVQQQLDAAIDDFEAALALKPGDVDILLQRAWAAFDKRDFDKVGWIVEKVLTADPNNPTAYEIYGSVAFRLKDYPAAKGFYDRAVALRPDFVHARFNRLVLYKITGAHRAVVEEADALLALDNPELDTLYAMLEKKRVTYRTMTRLERALIFETMGQTEQAERAFADWIAVEPNAVAFGYRAAFHERHEHYEQALADLDSALADDPTFWLLHHTQGRVYYYTHRDEDAIRAESRAIALNPDAGVSYWIRAVSERRLKQDDAALQDALKAVAVDRGVLALKIETLTKLGYLQIGPNDTKNPVPALAAAVQACMLDEECW